MSRLLVAESLILLRPVLAKILQDAGFEVQTAVDTREVVAALCDHEFDALIIDLDMSRCSGLNTVRYVRWLPSAKKLKIIGITTHGQRHEIMSSLKAGVNALLLLEDCTAELLVTRVRQMLTEPTAALTKSLPEKPPTPSAEILQNPPQPLVHDAIEQAIPRMLEAQALRPVVYKVIAMAGNPNVDAQSVAQILRDDLEMSAKVIAAANSAFYRRRNIVVRNLIDAINLIGLNTTRNLAMSLAVVDHFQGNESDPLLALPNLWGHSISTAHLAELLARETERCDPDQAYVVGLLHDLGRMLMAQHLPENYRGVVHSSPDGPLVLHELERRIVGTDHTQIGSVVTERWGCPPFISRAIRLHHSAALPSEQGEESLGKLLRIVLLADAMSIAFGFAGDQLEELPPIAHGWLAALVKEPAEFREKALDTLRQAQAMLMSRCNLSIEMPPSWAGEFEQIILFGASLHPLEPLQLMLGHAYSNAKFVTASAADHKIEKTLVLGDFRESTNLAEATGVMSWLSREKAPASWPVLMVSPYAAQLPGRRMMRIAPPIRPVNVRAAVESLAATTSVQAAA